MNKFAIIADDQTGAGDSGIHFARAGKAMALVLDYDSTEVRLETFNRVAISTDTRFFHREAAARQVKSVIRHCKEAGFVNFFKKIDSTMRGNTGSEIAAAIAATDSCAALICPAIPRLGRTCRDGMILVDGYPLADTSTGQDPFHPLTTSVISELLAEQIDLPSCNLSLSSIRGDASELVAKVKKALAAGCRLIIADAEVQPDLERLATVLSAIPGLLPVGAAGLAEAMSHQFSEPLEDEAASHPLAGRMLAVVGSLTDISRIQADFAKDAGVVQVLELDVAAAKADLAGEAGRLIAEIQNGPGGHLLLRTKLPDCRHGQPLENGELVADLLGGAARAICQQVSCPAVFATGGSTSIGVARALGIKVVILRREMMPGVVLGDCRTTGLGVNWFITKSGGFGDAQTIKKLADIFSSRIEDKNSS